MTQSNAGWSSHLASENRVADDLYPTPGEATQCLLRNVRFNGAIWECASGLGHISWELKQAGYEFVSTDLRAAEYKHGEVQDFLASTETRAPNIVTNPPYKLLREFLRKALTLSGVLSVAFFIPYPAIAYVGIEKLFQELGAPSLILAMVPNFKIWMGEERGWQQSFFKHCWLYWNREESKRTSSEFRLVDWRTAPGTTSDE